METVPKESPFELQPTLRGELIEMRPLREEDFDDLFTAASDPLIWEQHPNRERYQEPVFREFYKGAMDSGGAFSVIDLKSGQIVGSSRYHDYHPELSQIEIGYTFLARKYWGGTYNGEMKRLMMDHAFQFVDSIVFVIGPENWRSRKAVEKLGAKYVGTKLDALGNERVVYRVER